MRRISWPSMLTGLVVGILLTVSTAAAASSINVSFATLHFTVNGVDQTPPNGIFNNQGVPVPDAFIYDGTTYIPIRMAANLLDEPIQYIGSTRTVALGVQPTGAYLEDILSPYYVSNIGYMADNNTQTQQSPGNSPSFSSPYTMSLGGTLYARGIALIADYSYGTPPDGVVTFNLNGQYQTLSFLLGLDDANNQVGLTVTIQGDGNQLMQTTLNPGALPQNETINVSGVNQLQIQITGTGNVYSAVGVVDLVNPLITK